MAKVGILGQRHGADGIKATDYRSPRAQSPDEHHVFKVVYKVPTDVKMAVVDVDIFLQVSGLGFYAAVDIAPAYTAEPVCTGVLVVDTRVTSETQGNITEYTLNTFQRKCLVLGPGDTVFFRGPKDSNCVVTGIEHV